MRITVLVKNGFEEMFLKNPLVITKPSEIRLHSALVLWKYNNINTSEEDSITVGSTKVTFDHGYWNFLALKRKLAEEDVVLTLNTETYHCTVVCTKNVNLGNFGKLLGFNEGTTIAKNTPTISPKTMQANHELTHLNVSCNIVDTSKNIDQKGNYSNVVAFIPLISDRSLKGNLKFFNNVDSKVSINCGTYASLRFGITNNTVNTRDVGEFLLEFYITPESK